MSTKESIAFLGLGLMGTGMAGRVLEAGYKLSVFNRSAGRAGELEKKGARVAQSPRAAAEGADIIIAMLADDSASRAIWTGENGALARAKPGARLIECSTLSVDWVRELGELAVKHKCELLDCPVTGSKPQAAAGQLVFLAGGSAAALDRARPVLGVMGRDVNHLGPLGSGAMMKLINNFVCGVQLVALAEALGMIQKTGLDFAKAVEVLSEGAPGSPLVKTMSKRMLARDYTPNFELGLMAKDLTYAMAEARQRGMNLATAETALGKLKEAMAAGMAEKDLSSVFELFRK